MGLGQGCGRPGAHLVGEINLLLAVHLLADAALLGQLLQRLHHGLREAGGQQGPAPRPVRPSQARPGPARSPPCPARAPAAGSRKRPGRCRGGSAPAGTAAGRRRLLGDSGAVTAGGPSPAGSPPAPPALTARRGSLPPLAHPPPPLPADQMTRFRRGERTTPADCSQSEREGGRGEGGDWRRDAKPRPEMGGAGVRG